MPARRSTSRAHSALVARPAFDDVMDATEAAMVRPAAPLPHQPDDRRRQVDCVGWAARLVRNESQSRARDARGLGGGRIFTGKSAPGGRRARPSARSPGQELPYRPRSRRLSSRALQVGPSRRRRSRRRLRRTRPEPLLAGELGRAVGFGGFGTSVGRYGRPSVRAPSKTSLVDTTTSPAPARTQDSAISPTAVPLRRRPRTGSRAQPSTSVQAAHGRRCRAGTSTQAAPPIEGRQGCAQADPRRADRQRMTNPSARRSGGAESPACSRQATRIS